MLPKQTQTSSPQISITRSTPRQVQWPNTDSGRSSRYGAYGHSIFFFFFAGCFCSTQHSPNARRVTSLHKPQRTMLSAHQHVAGDSLAFSLPGAISPNNANRRFAAHSRPEYAPMAAWRQPSLYTKTASQPNMPPLHRRSWTPRDWQHNETRQEGVHRHRLPGRTRRKPCAIAMQNRTPPRTHVMAKTGFSNFFFFFAWRRA